MTNKFLLNLLGFNPDLTSRQPRVDSLSLVSRQSDLLTHLGRITAILVLVLTIGVGNAWGATATFTASDEGWTGTSTKTQTVSGVTFSFAGGTTNPTYYADGLRTYENCVITISSTNTITGIVFTYTTSNNGCLKNFNTGTWTSGTKTWSGSATSINCTVGHSSGTKNGQVRITSIVVTYTAAAVPTLTTSSSMTTLTYSGGSPVAQSFTIGGSNLTNTVRVTAPTDYQVSKSSGSGYANYIEFTNTEVNAADKTVYIRLRSGLSAGNIASRNITVTSSGATEKTIAVTGSVPYTITWMANGSTFSTTYVAVGSTLTLPASDPNPGTYSCAGKYFYGWYGDGSSYSHASTAPTIAATGNAVSADKTYYAVFADRSGSGAVTWDKVTSAPSDWSGDYIITNAGGSNAMISDFYSGSSGEFLSSSVTISGSQITSTPTDKMIWTIAKNGATSQYSLKNKSTGTYANITGTSSTNAALNASAVWFTISCSSGTCIINSVTYSARAFAWYSSRNSFRTYANTGNTYCNMYKKSGDGYTWSNYATTCCTALGTINGSINMTSSTDGTVTVKDWSEVSYASSYTVKLYQKNGESWDLVAGDAGTKTGITNRSTGATFSGLTYGATYKFKVTAIGTGSYCDGPETAVTSINGNSLTNNEFLNKYSIYIDNGTNSDTGWGHHYIESLSSHTGNVTLNSLTAGATYKFKLTLGGVIRYSANATMTSSNCTNWTFYSNVSENCGMTTGLGGNYIFAINAGTPTVSVTYPSASQAADKIIYWDASIHGDAWSKLCFRVGTSSNSNARETAKNSSNLVPGTDQFYKMLTCDFGSMEAWTIANNTGWTGTNSVYRTDDEGNYTVTKSIAYQDYAVVDPITIIPTTSGSAGGSSENDGCTFYTLTKYDGMLMHNISVGSADHGTVVATYTNTSGTTGQTVAEGANADLAHRCIVTITATPDAGYQLSSLTVNGAAFTSGSTHILAADATVAATFTAKTYNITLDREGADNGSTSVTMTYNSATHTAITAPTKSGYDFGGWYSGDNGTGTMVMNASGVLQVNVSDYTGAGGIWTRDNASTTLYAKWTPVNYTITYHLNDGTNPGGVPTGFTIESAAITLPTPTREGYNFMGWYANEDLSTGGVQTTIAAGLTGDKEYWAKWEIKKYTVTWHVGESTSTTSNVEHFTTFSTLEASAPAHADNALAACGSTKFIGWVKASGAWTEDGKDASWYNTHKFSSSDQITADTHVYAMYAEAAGAAIYSRVTSDLGATNWAGDYLIAYSSTVFADGSTAGTSGMGADGAKVNPGDKLGTLVDTVNLAWGNTYNVTLELIDNSTNTYVLKTKDGNYNYQTSNANGITSTAYKATAAAYPISVTFTSSSDIKLALGGKATGAVFRYNTNSSGYFRFYKDCGQSAVYLYKKTQNLTNYRTGCTVSCGAPSEPTNTSITAYGATISWTGGGTGTLDKYEYAVWVDGDDEPTSGFTSNGTNTSKTLTGLLSNTTYRWKVRKVCTGGDGESLWLKSSFTTSNVALTFNVPTGASAVDGQNSNVALPTADVPTDCGDCWAFAGWTTAAYAASSAPAKLFPADAPVHLAYEDGTALHAVYKKDEFAMIQTLEGLTENSYYVLTKVMDGGTYNDHEFAMTGAAVGNDLDGYDLTVNGYLPAYGGIFYVINPPVNAIWKFTGTAASGLFYNESVEKYLDLSSTSNPIVQAETDKHLTFTVIDGGEGYVDAFKLTDATTTTNMLYWGATDGDYGVTTESETNSGFLYKRTSCAYTTAPDCPKYTVTWDTNNGATTSTTEVTKCAGYLASLPTAPANNTLDACIGSGKGRFMGWSPNKVMPAQDVVPEGMFEEVEYAPEISGDVTFYAVFAKENTGATAATNRTYTFTSNAWADDESAWTSGSAGNALTSGRGVQVTTGTTGANATTNSSYDDVTKVVVTYSTNASKGEGSIKIEVGGTTLTGYSSTNANYTSGDGTADKTIDFTPVAPATNHDGAVKITVTCSTNSIYIKSVQIFYTGSTTTYEGYRTACCDDPQLTFGTIASPVTEYVIVREDLASASAGVEIDCNFESNNTSEDITWYSTHRDKNDYVGAYTWTSSQPTDRLEIDPTNKKIIAKETGSWQITIAQAMGSTNYCDETATVNIIVKTVDKFIDNVNGNFSGEAQRLEDTGNGILLPTEAMFSTNNGCSTTRRLIGWIKASDLATYASGRRVNMIDDLKTSDPATNKVIAPGTKVQATGVTWYAVWGEEK